MNINEILKKPEGRRLEFKETMPTQGSLPKTVIAFANDAGGEIYIGVRDNPREVTGLPEDKLVELEEQISNIIYDSCYPVILPDISFVTVEDKYLIKNHYLSRQYATLSFERKGENKWHLYSCRVG